MKLSCARYHSLLGHVAHSFWLTRQSGTYGLSVRLDRDSYLSLCIRFKD